MASLKQAVDLLGKLKAATDKNDLSTAQGLLDQLKLKMIELPALPPAFAPSPTAKEELACAREVLEYAVVLSLKRRDDAAMERAFTQLKAFYADTRALMPPSGKEHTMLGLYLMHLLVQNRIAEFHAELELLPVEALEDRSVKHATQLEQWLMEGAYNKVMGAAKAPLPTEFHGLFMSQLASTVRDEVASCSARAYARLSVKEAQRLMMFATEAELVAYAQKLGWVLDKGWIVFADAAEGAGGGGKAGAAAAGGQGAAAGSLGLIKNSLVYAKELERIV